MERSRITPRLRPRPYDLRRKVLLKNFFREQMTYIPLIRSTVESSLDGNNDSDLNENKTNSNSSEGNVLTPKKVQDNIVSAVAIPEPAPSTSNCYEKENSNNLGTSSSDEILSNSGEVEERQTKKFPRLSRIMETIDSQLSWRKNRRRGVTKAKYELRSNKGSQKPVGWKTAKNSESSGKAKSFFEIFKSRRNRKRSKTVFTKKTIFLGPRNPSPNHNKCDSNDATTSTQSVQTEISWSPDHYEKIEQSNRSLLEENRLLSESLSTIISTVDFRSGNLQNSYCTDAYTENVNKSGTHFSSDQKQTAKTECVGNNFQPVDFSRTRILRSKSLYDRSEKRSHVSSRLRTRSMNCKYNKRPTSTDSFSRNEPHFCDSKQYRVNSIASPIPNRSKIKSSIDENVDSLPLYSKTTRSHLQALPSKSGKTLMRRSSMPERTYYWNDKTRPVRSSSLRENDRCSYSSRRASRPNQFSHYRPNQSSHHHRSSTYNRYSYSVPFQDLPAEAFY